MARVIVGAPRKKPGRNAQATRVGELIFAVGSPFDWNTGEIVKGTIEDQTKQSMKNIETTLKSCGSSLDSIDKCTVFVNSKEAASIVNEIYYSYFPETTPVRTCVVVEFPNPMIMIEIEVIAHVEGR